MRGRGNGVGIAVLAGAGLIFAVVVALALRRPPPRSTHVEGPPPIASERFPNEWPNPPPADVAALLDGLAPGASLEGGWRVRGVSPVTDGHIVIDVARGEIGFRVVIVQKGKDPRRPPAESARYALYTAQPRPAADSIKDEDYAPVLSALRARLAKTESRVATPRGM
jgi:hypothetical protein